MTDPKTPSAPHDCPQCGEPAYVGGPGMPAQCTQKGCIFYSEDAWVLHVLELPDVEDPFEDVDTEPNGFAAWLPEPKLSFPSLDDYLHAYPNPPPIKNLTYKQQADKVNDLIDKMPVPWIILDDKD
jgi:hypothetical protein